MSMDNQAAMRCYIYDRGLMNKDGGSGTGGGRGESLKNRDQAGSQRRQSSTRDCRYSGQDQGP